MMFLRITTLLLGLILLPSIGSASEPVELRNWLNQVVSQHPRLQAAQAAVDNANATVRGAGQPLFNPEIEFEYESTDVDTKTAGISQTIDLGDKQSAYASIAGYQRQQSHSELKLQQQQLAADALFALASYQSSIESKQVAKKRSDSMAEFLSISKQRYELGDLTEVELALAQLASSEASFQLADATSGLIASEQLLYVLLGDDSNRLSASLPVMDGIPSSPDLAFNKEDVLDKSPKMELLRSRMDIARAEIKLRQRQQRPNPTIGIKAGKEGDEYLTNVTFSMPLFVRNNYSAEVDAANAKFIQRQREAMDTRRLLAAKLTTAAQTLKLNRNAWLQWQAVGQGSLVQQEVLLKRLWKTGELSTADFLVQLKQALDTQASAIKHKTQLWKSWTQWLTASGEINQWITPVMGEEK